MKQKPRNNRRRRLKRRKKHERRLLEKEEERSRNSWLCDCGNWIEDGLHCEMCGREPPWGCPCSWCQDRYGDEDGDFDDGYPDDFNDEELYCAACGNTGWVWGSDGLGMECGECNH